MFRLWILTFGTEIKKFSIYFSLIEVVESESAYFVQSHLMVANIVALPATHFMTFLSPRNLSHANVIAANAVSFRGVVGTTKMPPLHLIVFVRIQTFMAIPDLVAVTPELASLQQNLEDSVLDSGAAGANKGLQQREISAALLKAENNINVANQSL